MQVLDGEIIPTYYQDKPRWVGLMKRTMRDITPHFNTNRIADEYYRIMYKG